MMDSRDMPAVLRDKASEPPSFEDAVNEIVRQPPVNRDAVLSGGTTEPLAPMLVAPTGGNRTARTVVGRAVLANGPSIILALAGLQIQIEAKLDALKQQRLNTDEWH
jgi:hypothetical protein